MLSSAGAYAVSDNVRQACKDDYYQHCSQFSVGTEELRQCMRKVGEGLSAPCLVALVQAGEITQADVERHNAAKAGKNTVKMAADDKDTNTAVDPKDVSSKSIKSRKAAKALAAADTKKTGKVSKKKAASSKTKPRSKTKTKAAATASAAPGNPSKNVSAVKNDKNHKSKKAAKKLSNSKPSAVKPGSTKPATTKPVASKKIKKVPVSQSP